MQVKKLKVQAYIKKYNKRKTNDLKMEVAGEFLHALTVRFERTDNSSLAEFVATIKRLDSLWIEFSKNSFKNPLCSCSQWQWHIEQWGFREMLAQCMGNRNITMETIFKSLGWNYEKHYSPKENETNETIKLEW